MPERLLTTAEVAAYFQVTPRTVNKWVKDGVLRGIKVPKGYRFRPSDVEALLPIAPEPAT